MKKERGFVGLGLALIINYMMHQMYGPAIYFGVVLCGLMVFYGKVDVEKMMKQAVVYIEFYTGNQYSGAVCCLCFMFCAYSEKFCFIS